MTVTRRRAPTRLANLFPDIGPWTRVALWHGLIDVPTPDSPLDGELQTVLQQRLAPLLLDHLADATVAVSSESIDALRTDAMHRLGQSLMVAHHGQLAIARLRDAGIDCVVSKGPGIALLYRSPELRPFSDIDVLVAEASFARAMRILRAAGYAERAATRQPWLFFDRLCREGVNLRSPEGGSVDLHHHVPPWFWGRRLRTADLAFAAEERCWAQVVLPCASVEANLLIACLHIVSDKNAPGATLLIWRDIAELAAAADPQRAHELAVAAGLSVWVSAILKSLPVALQPDALITLCEGGERDLRGRKRLRMLLAIKNTEVNVVVSQILRLPAPNAVLYLVGMVFPSRGFLQSREVATRRTHLGWWTGSMRTHALHIARRSEPAPDEE